MKMITKKCVFLLSGIYIIPLILDKSEGAPDNKGKEFIIGFMENDISSDNPFSNELFVTTTRTTTVTVRVQAPKYTSISLDETFTVTDGVVKQLFIDSNIRMVGTSFGSKGILVTADDEIVIYGVNKEKYSNDAYLGLPTDILGTDYYVVSWTPERYFCGLLVVAVHNDTSVNIKLGPGMPSNSAGSVPITWQGTNYYSGETITLVMDQFDTFQVAEFTGDITGSRVTSDKVVSVFSGNKRTYISPGTSRDHIVEQIPPVSKWGKKFATIPIPERTIGDFWKFVASEDNSQVSINCNGYTDSFTLSLAGSYNTKDIPSTSYCYVVADKPILVAQFCKSQTTNSEMADPLMMLIPPIELHAADYTFTTPKYSLGSYENFFMFVIKDTLKDGLLVDGSPFPNSTVYNAIPGTDLVGGYIELLDGSHTVRHTSTIVVFGGYLYGKANYETYGFATGSRFASINEPCLNSTTELGDGVNNDCDDLIDEESCTDNPSIDDDGDGLFDEDCAMPFPVDGNWTAWDAWSPCSVTCNGTGALTRTRTCTNPAPAYDGDQCIGNDTDVEDCTSMATCEDTKNENTNSSNEKSTNDFIHDTLTDVFLIGLLILCVTIPICCCILVWLLRRRGRKTRKQKKNNKDEKIPVTTVTKVKPFKDAWNNF